MNSYSYTSSSSSSTQQFSSYQPTERKSKPQPSYQAALHSVGKLPHPKPMTKKPIAPLPPTPPRIYQVDCTNFKQLVQKLTSLPEFQSRNLHDLAPPPLSLRPSSTEATSLQPLSSSNVSSSSSPTFHNLLNEAQDTDIIKQTDNFQTPGPLGFSMSPSSLAWCSYLLQSSASVPTLEQGTV